jgi:hypothetical protein
VIAEKTRSIIFPQQFEPALVEPVEAVIPALNMIENAEFDLAHRASITRSACESSAQP